MFIRENNDPCDAVSVQRYIIIYSKCKENYGTQELIELRCHLNFHGLHLQLRIVALLNGAKIFLLYNSISAISLG